MTEVRFPSGGAGRGAGFVEVAPRHGDYAVCAVACALRVEGGVVTEARLGAGAVSDRPLVLPTAARALAQTALRRVSARVLVVVAVHPRTTLTGGAGGGALAERVVGVDPTRAEGRNRHRAEFVERFEALATPIDGMFTFDQENRVKVYRRL